MLGATMRVSWVDPLNRDPHFLNVLSLALGEAGHDVRVWSIARAGFKPPPGVAWTPFAAMARPPFSLKRRPAAMRVAASYPFLWRRAVRDVVATGARAVLATTGLALPRWDARAMRAFARGGVAPVVIVHLPYPGFLDDPRGRRAGRYRNFYAAASRLLFMNADTRARFLETFSVPEDRCATIPAPHYAPILDAVEADRGLAERLRDWAGGAPVVTFLSNMRSEHGFSDLLAGLALLDARLDDWRLLVVSSAVSRRRAADVEASLERLGLRRRSWCAWRPYPVSYLKAYLGASSVVAVPYRDATQSGAVASARGAGVPVVATEVGGLPESIRPGIDGELAAPGDPVALADALAKVAADADAYRQRKKARRRPPGSPEATAKAVVEALRDAAVPGRRRLAYARDVSPSGAGRLSPERRRR